MKLFRESLKNRLVFSLLVILLSIAVLFYAVVYLQGNLFVFIPVILLVVFFIGYLLVEYVYHPFEMLIESMETGLDCLRDNDFSVNIADQNYSEFKNSIDTYNELADFLREERKELHQRELLLDTVIQSTPMAILLTSDKDVIAYSNLAARKLLDHPNRLESLKLSSIINGMPEELKKASLQKQEGLYNVQLKDQKNVFYLTFQEFKLNAQNHCLYLYKNMTSEVSKEELLIWKKVIRLISHELNNSLAPIQSLTNSANKIVSKLSDNEMLVDILNTIDRRSKHLHQFIEKYAKFSRLPNPMKRQVNVENFITSLEKICAIKIKIESEISSEDVKFDSSQIEQVIINLIKNAKESGGDESEVESEIKLSSNNFLFRVKDRGKGMKEEQLTQALLPFFTTKNTGSGLGLALSNEIVNAHDGRLRLYNRPQGGLVVEFEIPCG